MRNKKFRILIIIFIPSILAGCVSFHKKNKVFILEEYKSFTYIVDTVEYPNSSLVLFYEKEFTMPIITNDTTVYLLKDKKNNARYFIERELGYFFLADENFSAFLSWISANSSEMVKYFKSIDKYDYSCPKDTILFNKNEKRIIYNPNYNFKKKKFLVLMLKMDPNNFNNPLFFPSTNLSNPYYIKVLCPLK